MLLARVVFSPVPSVSSDCLTKLRWLSTDYRINNKLTIVTYRALHSSEPSYLSSLLNCYITPRSLRSSTSGLLVTPFVRTPLGPRAFCVAAPKIWYTLPPTIFQAILPLELSAPISKLTSSVKPSTPPSGSHDSASDSAFADYKHHHNLVFTLHYISNHAFIGHQDG